MSGNRCGVCYSPLDLVAARAGACEFVFWYCRLCSMKCSLLNILAEMIVTAFKSYRSTSDRTVRLGVLLLEGGFLVGVV